MVGWGIIGIGKLSDIAIAPAIGAQGDSTLAAVCSRNLQRAEQFGERHGAALAYDDLARMVEDPTVDVVYVATPNALHLEHGLAAIRAGKHVLMEKPMTVSVEEGRQLVDAADAARVHLGVAFQLRHKETNHAARAAIADGRIGPVAFLDLVVGAGKETFPFDTWRADPALAGGGTLLNQGTHGIDLLEFLTGDRIVEVACLADADELEEVVAATCRLSRGALAALSSNQVLGGTRRDWIAIGHDAWLEGRRSLANPAGDEVVLHRAEGETVMATSQTSAYEAEVDAFVHAVLGRAPVNGDGTAGLRNAAAVEALYRSARDRRAVPVEDVG
jgi:1,5-anhydro-D-fructose reductase (1,5-anhydro-D-mannitol-forming)